MCLQLHIRQENYEQQQLIITFIQAEQELGSIPTWKPPTIEPPHVYHPRYPIKYVALDYAAREITPYNIPHILAIPLYPLR
jgi:hypothetical protein